MGKIQKYESFPLHKAKQPLPKQSALASCEIQVVQHMIDVI
jgi:hypothetical protein